MNDQEFFWKEEYDSEYIRKNSSFDNEIAIKGWNKMLNHIHNLKYSPASILECGSNIGRNINYLNKIFPLAEKSIIEVSPRAIQIASNKYELKFISNSSILESKIESKFDLVFTMGVLIHIHPDNLIDNLKKIYEYSSKFILIGEYFNRTPEMIKYQGKLNKLFKNNFGKIFKDNFDVRTCDYGFLWGEEYDSAGFDDITYWLFEK